ncbi:MAG: hypothetical protein F4Z17_07790 [Acidimicrobiia bacterium]|nr:hypothetical protein [Acidimicrobiia bacterium]
MYLPDDLYREVKDRGFSPSKLLQEAVRVELRRQRLLGETDSYLAEVLDKVGEPDAEDYAWAQALADRIARRVQQEAV